MFLKKSSSLSSQKLSPVFTGATILTLKLVCPLKTNSCLHNVAQITFCSPVVSGFVLLSCLSSYELFIIITECRKILVSSRCFTVVCVKTKSTASSDSGLEALLIPHINPFRCFTFNGFSKPYSSCLRPNSVQICFNSPNKLVQKHIKMTIKIKTCSLTWSPWRCLSFCQ